MALQSGLNALVGVSRPFDQEDLRARYADRIGFVDAYATAIDACVTAGVVLEDDRADLVAHGDAVAERSITW